MYVSTGHWCIVDDLKMPGGRPREVYGELQSVWILKLPGDSLIAYDTLMKVVRPVDADGVLLGGPSPDDVSREVDND